jgi:hypothetical protein
MKHEESDWEAAARLLDQRRKTEEQGARSRNAVASVASDVPLLLIPLPDPTPIFIDDTVPLAKFYVSKVQLEEALKFISEGHDAEQRQARRRQAFARLIAASSK